MSELRPGAKLPDDDFEPEPLEDERDGWDFGGRAHWEGGEVVLDFGQHEGEALRDLARDDETRGYLEWMEGEDFPPDLITAVEEALER